MKAKNRRILKSLALSYPTITDEIMLDEIKDNEKREKQLQNFKNSIIYSINPNQFEIYDFEPTWGKTTEAKSLLLEYKKVNPNKRILWVTEKKEDCKKIANDINVLFGEKVAKAIIGGMSKETRKKILKEYEIVIITHERYRRISRIYNQEERVLYQEDRHLLIIDEHINMCREIEFKISKNAKLRNRIMNIAGKNAIKKYDFLVKELLEFLKDKNKSNVNNKGLVFETCSKLQDIERNIISLTTTIFLNLKEDKTLKEFDYDNENKQTTIEQIEDLREFYTDTTIVVDYSDEDGEVVLKVPNNSMKMWKLEYNCILDATASIDKSYSFDKQEFNIKHQDRIYDHKYWTILWAKVNTTSYGRRKVYEDFDNTINDIVTNFLGKKYTLAMCNKKNDVVKVDGIDKKIKNFKGKTEHYGNTNGSNKFANCLNFINIDMNYIENSVYVIKYLYYSNNKIDNWRSGRGKFINEDLEMFKIYEIGKSHCQAIKRINRKMIHRSIVVFLCHREDIKEITFKTLKGCDIIYCEELEKLFVKKNPDNVEKFINICEEIINTGKIPIEIKQVLQKDKFKKYSNCIETFKIPKIVFAEALGSGNDSKKPSNSFGTNVLKNEEVIEFLEKNNIVRSNKTIDFMQKK